MRAPVAALRSEPLRPQVASIATHSAMSLFIAELSFQRFRFTRPSARELCQLGSASGQETAMRPLPSRCL